MSPLRWMVFTALLALLVNCGGQVPVDYAAIRGGSMNGIALLNDHWQHELNAKPLTRLSPRLDHAECILHVVVGSGLPDVDAWTWLEKWLAESSKRQVVIVLRDGNVSGNLLERWATEARSQADRLEHSDTAKREALQRSATRLNDLSLAHQQADQPLAADGISVSQTSLRVTGIAPLSAPHLSGLIDGPAPATLLVRSELHERDERRHRAEVWLRADGHPVIIAIPIANSRLVVVSTATAFLDAALVDATARHLLASFTQRLAEWPHAQTFSVETLVVREGEPAPQSMLAGLFGVAPFNYVVFHLLAVVLVFLGWKAGWLGRTMPPTTRRLERFGQHVDALADQLRRIGAIDSCCTAVAKHLKRMPPPSPPPDVDQARATIATWYDAATPAPVLPPRSP